MLGTGQRPGAWDHIIPFWVPSILEAMLPEEYYLSNPLNLERLPNRERSRP
jgi:hypothetical protein